MLPLASYQRRIALLTWLIALSGAEGGEISPLVLPSQRQSSMVRPPVGDADKREQYYADFKRDMLSRSRSQRDALSIEFRRRLDVSRTDAERAHYQRLLGILADIQSAGGAR